MITFHCTCGHEYTQMDAVSSHDGKGKIVIHVNPCQNCTSFGAGVFEDLGRLKEQKRIGKIVAECFGRFDGCDAVDFDVCIFHDACQEYSDGNLPDVKETI